MRSARRGREEAGWQARSAGLVQLVLRYTLMWIMRSHVKKEVITFR